jgi:hypothetical protein
MLLIQNLKLYIGTEIIMQILIICKNTAKMIYFYCWLTIDTAVDVEFFLKKEEEKVGKIEDNM